MLNKVKAFIEKNILLQEGSRVLVALSGGRDSVALLHTLHRLGYDIEAAHVNYGLRGEASSLDETFCRALCGRLSIPIHILNEKPVGNIQQSARDIRYAFFDEVAAESGIAHIATGHHLDDQLETLVFRFLRGTGVEGMAGISAQNASRIRPLLGLRRHEITEYLQTEGLTWREDASNETLDYDRNRIRHEIMPVLTAFAPDLAEVWNRQAGMFKATSAFLDLAADTWESQEIEWPMDELQSNHPVLWKLLERRGFTSRQMDEVIALKDSQPGSQVLSSSHRVVRDRTSVWLSPRETKAEESMRFNTTHDLSRFFEVDHVSPVAFQMPADHWSAVFDPTQLSFPLMLRPWSQGDRFRPLGSDGSQLISDLLVQRKVPLHQKDRVLVLEDGKDILWVIGFHRSGEALVTDDSPKALILKAPETHQH